MNAGDPLSTSLTETASSQTTIPYVAATLHQGNNEVPPANVPSIQSNMISTQVLQEVGNPVQPQPSATRLNSTLPTLSISNSLPVFQPVVSNLVPIPNLNFHTAGTTCSSANKFASTEPYNRTCLPFNRHRLPSHQIMPFPTCLLGHSRFLASNRNQS